MAASRRTGRSRLTLALLVITSLAVLTLDFRDAGPIRGARELAATVFSPLRGVADSVSSPFSNAWDGITDYGDVKAENEELKEQLAALEGAEAQNTDAVRQLEVLLAQDGLDWVGTTPTKRARVVAGPVSNFSYTIEINKGSGDGVKVGMPVVNGSGLVGIVVQASSGRSTVQLLTDPDFRVGIRLADTGTQGTARGAGRGNPLEVDTALPPDAVLEKDVPLVTSGSDRSKFPASIPVGKVVESRPASNGLTKEVVAEPYADTGGLSYVSVLLYEEPTG